MNVFVLLNTKEDILKEFGETEQFWGTIDFHCILFPTMEVNGAPKQPGYKLSSKYLPLCSAEQRHSYRFGTTWGWVNDDTIFIFGWTIPLRVYEVFFPFFLCFFFTLLFCVIQWFLIGFALGLRVWTWSIHFLIVYIFFIHFPVMNYYELFKIKQYGNFFSTCPEFQWV